jgi:hypothetical protein
MGSSARRPCLAALALLLALGWAAPAGAQDYFSGAGEPLRFEVDRPRERSDKILMASLFGGSVLLGGVGLLFHLDSQRKSSEVSAVAGRHTGRIYTEELDDTRRAALRSRTFAIVGYSMSGALLLSTFVVYLVTDPGRETITVGDQLAPTPAARLMVEPVPGGALVGGQWTF